MPATLANAPPARPHHPACPRCTAPMHALTLPSHRQQPITVDHCPACRLVWFDELESVQLDGLGWVRLLREMEDGRQRPLADAAVARPACPACAVTLKPVQNRTRYGLFAALECPQRHGHLHSHSGLLAERGLVRPLGAAERRALAQEGHRLHCFNCGAPAASTDDHCSYCRTALVVLDLPRLAHSLRLRNDAMAPSPTAPGRHAVWQCRGCGAALDPGRQTSCPHCSHLVVAQELPDVLPLLEAAEAEQAAAAAVDAERRARFASTRRQAAAPRAPPRALTMRPPPRPGLARTLLLAGWLPLWLLLATALLLAAMLANDVRLKAPPPLELLREQRVGSDPRALWGWAEAWRLLQPQDAEGLRRLRRGLFDIYTRQISGDRWPADATVASVMDAAPTLLYPLHRDEKDRWDIALMRQLKVQPDSLEKPLEEAVRDPHSDGQWAPTVENAGPSAWPVERLTVRMLVVGPDGPSWRCEAPTGARPWLAPGQSVSLVCRSQVQVKHQQDQWIEALNQLRSGSTPKLVWQDEAITQRGAWARAVDQLIADAARSSPALDHFLRRHTDLRRGVPPVAGAAAPPAAWRALLTRQGWADMSTARRQGMGLAAVLAAFVAFCALARGLGERRARVTMVLAAVPLAYLAGRGEGAASVLLVGMYLSLTVILALAFSFAFRLYRDLVFSRFD